MPYIKQKHRNLLDEYIDGVIAHLGSGPVYNTGWVNYAITRIVLGTIVEYEVSASELSYEDYNRAIGVLECVKLELYRRQVAAYEDVKILENGDVR